MMVEVMGDVRGWCNGEMMWAKMGKQCKVQGVVPTHSQGWNNLTVNTEPRQGAVGR